MTEAKADYEVKRKVKTIFRTVKNEDHPFVMMDRRPLENPALSWRAKGVLAYLLSRPDNWTVRVGDLVKRSTDGVFSIRSAIRELEAAGHVHRKEERDPKTKRIVQYVLEVYELPFATKPLTNLPQAENLQAGNRALNDTDLRDKDSKEKEVAAAKPPRANTIPEVVLFREVTHKYPPAVNFPDVVAAVGRVGERLGRAVTVTDLLQFYKAWCSKGFNPGNLAWLTDWAASGVIPANGKIAQQSANEPKAFEPLRRWLAQKEQPNVNL